VEIETATATTVEVVTGITTTTMTAIITTILAQTTTETTTEMSVETTVETTMITAIAETIVSEADETKNTINVLAIAEIYKRVTTLNTAQMTAAAMEIQTISRPLSSALH
jgi:hypothetical protein